MKKITTALLVVLLCSASSKAQELLDINKAIEIGLENNYSIRIARNDEKISTNNARDLYTTLLPVASASAGFNGSRVNTRLVFNTDSIQNRNWAESHSYNGNVGLSWTIFDGLRMFATYDKYKEFEKLGETNTQITVLQTVYAIVSTYYTVVSQQNQTKSLRDALELSRKRVKDETNKYSVGKASKLDVLNSTVDLNADTTNLMRQLQNLQSSKILLNQLLARDVTTNFNVTDTIIIDYGLKYETVRQSILTNNPQLKAAQLNKNIASLTYKEIRGDRFPLVKLNTGYNYTKSQSSYGQVLSNLNNGLNYGATASINLFNGLIQNKREQNARTEINTSGLLYEQLKQGLDAQLSTAYINYQNSISLVGVEAANRQVALQNQDITFEKYKLGSVTQLELRQAQQNFIIADFRYINAQYDAKTAEIALKLLAGNVR
ncbi:TolC family protein [Solitalea sp. MAHUQ-68]|uniref:TolC family protein n=1 Tax=Solitalea agri TaxID=2953739 RepID=A0A9X2F3Q2_9SPHI|nr:TolC family protein [Solitalea agri]MCO4293670.1 TolC family protein [Solitalea agri]